jgi:hypothetical protein
VRHRRLHQAPGQGSKQRRHRLRLTGRLDRGAKDQANSQPVFSSERKALPNQF